MAYCSIRKMTVFENQTREILFPPPLSCPKEGPPVRKVLVQWWGCGAAGIKSEKYFPQMVVNIAWQYMACNFKWLFFFLCWPVSLTLLLSISKTNNVLLTDFY